MRAFSVGFAFVSTPGGTVSSYGNLTIIDAHIKGFAVKDPIQVGHSRLRNPLRNVHDECRRSLER